jgi:uncharacterized damage-inducible protein DinB
MKSGTVVNALFGFQQAMNERLWAIIMEHLSDAQFVQDDDYSRGSIRNQIVHMANAQHYWLRGVLNMRDLPSLRAEDYGTREAARAVCRQTDAECLKRVRGLSEADLERVPDGWSQPVWVALVQLAHHSTDHRAQILHALYGMGAPTFEQNFAVYMEHATPMSVPELAEHISGGRAAWDEALRQVPEGQMEQPLLDEWTVRDTVAILTWKEQQVAESMRQRAVLETSFGQLPRAEQERVLADGRALSLPALLQQHGEAHQEMLQALQTLSEEELNSEHVEGLPADERFWKAIAGPTWWSYPSFARSLRRLLQEEGSGVGD